MNLINEVDKPVVKKTIVIYAGRFQPFHKGHYDAYNRLVSKFGSANVYIGTSNDTSSSKSPFSFSDKKKIATTMFGIPASKFIQVSNPYRPVEILKKYDGKTTQYIAAVGEKDATRLQGKYFKPYRGISGYGYDEIGYTFPIPAEKNPISGTDVRKGLGSKDEKEAKKFFLKAYPKYDKEIFTMIKRKLTENTMMGLPAGYPSKEQVKDIENKNKEIRSKSDTNKNFVYDLVDEMKDDVNQFISEYFNDNIGEDLLLEGGAYGHMSHPFDDMDLTFGDLKNIISKALNGDLGVVREKTDGQALAISWKNGRLIAARNKSHLSNAGANALGIDGIASKFAGRGGLTDAYNFAMKDLSAAITGLSLAQKNKIFKNGKSFMNIEVIWPTSVNVIPYGQALLVFHNAIEYDDRGNAIGKVDGAESILAGMIKQINAHVQSKYTIQGPPITSIPKNDKLSNKQSKYFSKLNKLQSQFGLSDSDNVANYHQAWWDNFIKKNAPKGIDKLTKDALVRRWAFGDKSFRLNTISKPDLQKWAIENDKVSVTKQQKDNIRPFEEIFLGVGADVLEFVSSVLTVHPDKAIRSMKEKLKSVASQVRSGGDPSKVQKLKQELTRLNALGGIDRIVASEGLVFFYGGKTYKLTGTFAPLNQILGIFYE